MTKIISTFIVLLLFGVTFGQSVSDESLLGCKGIEGLTERLVCYDSITESLTVTESLVVQEENQESQATVASNENWFFHSQIDAFNDSESFMLMNEAFEVNSRFSHHKIYLVIVCYKDTQDLRLIFSWDNFLGSDEKQIVTYRIDSEDAVRRQWYISGNNKDNTLYSYGEETTLKLIKAIAGSKTGDFIAQTQAYSNDIVQAAFDVSGLSDVMYQVLEPCGIE